MKKILVITTKGCEACRILNNLIKKAIENTDIQIEIKDQENIDKEFLEKYHVTDFPTTFLIENDNILFVFTGTKPVNIIKKYIELHFVD